MLPMRHYRLLAATAAISFIFCATTQAQIFKGLGHRKPVIGVEAPIIWGAPSAPPKVWRGPPPRYTNPEYYDNLRARYPKFQYGFHSSYFHNMGLPPGDIGIRGNGIYMTPW